jgi:hypothetical protein
MAIARYKPNDSAHREIPNFWEGISVISRPDFPLKPLPAPAFSTFVPSIKPVSQMFIDGG